MNKLLVMSAVTAVAAIAVACGSGGSGGTKNSAPPSNPTTAPQAASADATPTVAPATPAELATDVTTLKGIMQQVIAKAQAGDVQGTRDTEGTMDDAIEAIVRGTKAVDANLADQIETRELDIEHQADASTTDVNVIAKDAQEILPLLDQVVSTLKLPGAQAASASSVDTAALSKDVTTLRGIMQQVIAKAQAGDVQGTRDTEGTMDDSIEAIVKATKPVDPNLSGQIEALELDIEHQADASTTDVNVIAKDAQAILPLLDKVVTTMKLSA